MMKSQTLCLQRITDLPGEAMNWQIRIPAMVISIRQVVAVLGASVAALLLLTLTVWFVEMGLGPYIAPVSWGVAMIFMASALDHHEGTSIAKVLTALGLAALAWAQYFIAAEWGIVAAILLAPWLIMAVYKRLQRQDRSADEPGFALA